ncbi:alpha/beta hydrolase [Rubritalea marina]|uniref:alpha/beta hydrolase n=1 Tax=Rubritalea marina TaxID=361055 RepID=UPI0003670CF9|nr:alpha/beta hydrolase [Rubritalea marina]
MKHHLHAILLSSAVGLANFTSAAPTVTLWPEGTALTDPTILEEEHEQQKGTVRNIHNPNLTVHTPQQPNGAAVVICPGGGYHWIASGHEGHAVAKRLNQEGITAFVLKYRLPTTPDVEYKHPIPVSDALRAVQWVRFHAKDYQLDPQKIGLMGFSAGGHLTATAGTHFDKVQFGSDAIAKVSSRPDFLGLGYAVISTRPDIAHGCVTSPLPEAQKTSKRDSMSMESHVTAQTPPAFIFHAKDDQGVLPGNSEAMHQALKEKGVPSELKLYEKGGHGFGLGRPENDSSQWSRDFIAWLKQQNFIPKD